MHVDRAIARTGEAIAQPEVGALGFANQFGKGFDFGNRRYRKSSMPIPVFWF